MKLLLDSHSFYWWMIGSTRLSSAAKSLIENKSNAVLVSAVSFYELESKARRKNLDLKPQEIRASLTRNGLQGLPITDLHAELAATLDWDHHNPWDRILAAQSRLEQCTLISANNKFDIIHLERTW